MSRHELVLISHDQLRPLSFKSRPVCLATTLISGHDIVCGRDLFCSVFLQLHVTTSLSSNSSSFGVVTSVLDCDHFAICMITSCCDFDSLVAIVLVVFLSS